MAAAGGRQVLDGQSVAGVGPTTSAFCRAWNRTQGNRVPAGPGVAGSRAGGPPVAVTRRGRFTADCAIGGTGLRMGDCRPDAVRLAGEPATPPTGAASRERIGRGDRDLQVKFPSLLRPAPRQGRTSYT